MMTTTDPWKSDGCVVLTTQAGMSMLNEQSLKLNVKTSENPQGHASCWHVSFAMPGCRYSLSATIYRTLTTHVRRWRFTSWPLVQGSTALEPMDLPVYAMFLLDCHRRLVSATKDGNLKLEALQNHDSSTSRHRHSDQ